MIIAYLIVYIVSHIFKDLSSLLKINFRLFSDHSTAGKGRSLDLKAILGVHFFKINVKVLKGCLYIYTVKCITSPNKYYKMYKLPQFMTILYNNLATFKPF